MARRKKRSPPPRCNDCRALITFKRSADNGRWRPFQPREVDGRTHTGAIAYPIYGNRYWRLEDLANELQVQQQYSRERALDEVYDLPWFVVHTCNTTTPEGTQP